MLKRIAGPVKRGCFFICLFYFSCLSAQKTAYVVERESRKPIEDMTLFFSGDRGVFSGPEGGFSVPGGTDSLYLHKPGYRDTVILSFREGDTLVVKRKYEFLGEAVVRSEAGDLRNFLMAVLLKSARRYAGDEEFLQAYTYTEDIFINDSRQFSLYVPRAWFNAFDDRVPFARCYFLPADSPSVRISDTIDTKLIRGPLGFYAFRRILPFPDIPGRLTDKGNTYSLSYRRKRKEGEFGLAGIREKGIESEARITFKEEDSLVTTYSSHTISSTAFADMMLKAGSAIIYEDYHYRPPYACFCTMSYAVREGVYLLSEIHYVLEVRFVHKETGELKIMRKEVVARCLPGKARPADGPELSGAKPLGGTIDGYTKMGYYDEYLKRR